MNPEEQRIAIAKACGWTRFTPDTIQYLAQRADGKWDEIPDYLNDLNAMHEAQLCIPAHLIEPLLDELSKAAGYKFRDGEERNAHLYYCWDATAAQRAEAFLRTLDLWKD